MAYAGQNWSRECECGNPKGNRELCCKRCAFLDGARPGPARLINALREAPALSIAEIVMDSGAPERSVRRMLAILARRGRVRSIEVNAGRQDAKKLWALVDPRGATA
jgi:hypothetical protein